MGAVRLRWLSDEAHDSKRFVRIRITSPRRYKSPGWYWRPGEHEIVIPLRDFRSSGFDMDHWFNADSVTDIGFMVRDGEVLGTSLSPSKSGWACPRASCRDHTEAGCPAASGGQQRELLAKPLPRHRLGSNSWKVLAHPLPYLRPATAGDKHRGKALHKVGKKDQGKIATTGTAHVVAPEIPRAMLAEELMPLALAGPPGKGDRATEISEDDEYIDDKCGHDPILLAPWATAPFFLTALLATTFCTAALLAFGQDQASTAVGAVDRTGAQALVLVLVDIASPKALKMMRMGTRLRMLRSRM